MCAHVHALCVPVCVCVCVCARALAPQLCTYASRLLNSSDGTIKTVHHVRPSLFPGETQRDTESELKGNVMKGQGNRSIDTSGVISFVPRVQYFLALDVSGDIQGKDFSMY